MPFEDTVVEIEHSIVGENEDYTTTNVISELQSAIRKTIGDDTSVYQSVHTSCSLISISRVETVNINNKKDYLDEPGVMLECESNKDPGSISPTECSESNSSERSCMLTKVQNNRLKRIQELRHSRRNLLIHDDAAQFEILNDDFNEKYMELYLGLVKDASKDAVYLYQFLVNSFYLYHRQNNMDQDHEKLFLDFLRNRLLYTNKDLCIKHVEVSESAQLEVQVQILLQCHALQLEGSDNIDDIVKNLRCLYIWSDSTTMKSFLEEQICDLFAHQIPRSLCQIFDELCVTLPVDLEEYGTDSVERDEPLPWVIKQPNTNQLKELNKIINDIALADSVSDVFNVDKKNKRRLIGEKKLEISPTKAVRTLRKIPKIVPDTPEEKLKKELPTESSDVVKQTPMAKLRGVNKKSSKRLSELVKLSEERTRTTRGSMLPMNKAKAIINSTVAPNSNKQLLLGLNTPSPRPNRTARLNLIDRFVATPEPTSRRSPRKNLVTKRSADESTTQEKKKLKLDSQSGESKNLDKTPDTIGSIAGFTSDQLKKYKQRMLEISRTKNIQITDSESRERTSLFEDFELENAQIDPKNVQKNRTGRTVRAPSSTVHIAHILLNVHNPSPLDPFKTGKLAAGTATKLQRLVRIAKKKDKLKLNRLRSRNRIQPSSPSGSQKSDSTD